MQLELFRLKVFFPAQLRLLEVPAARGDLLNSAIREQPTGSRYRGVEWHVGNVQDLGQQGLYFRFGRRTQMRLSVLDDRGDFVDAAVDRAPYTHVLCDTTIGLCAISKNTLVAVNTLAAALRLAQVLTGSEVAREQEARMGAGPVSDPGQFLEVLQSALTVRSFTFSFQRRNPFDADAMFVQPFERMVEAAGGSSGTATVKGSDLERDALQQVARSAAATGDDARARVILDAESGPVVKRLRGATAEVFAPELETVEQRRAAMAAARAEHARIRGSTGDE